MLNVRLEDAEHAALKQRAEVAGLSVSALVKDWIGSSGDGEAVPPPASADVVSPPPTEPPFLAAPVDTCPMCSHDRQEADHLGGRPCTFKLGRRNCGCTFEGF
jgi:hypothetical protein